MEKLPNLTIMQVIPRLEAGGAEQTTLEINRALVKAGHKSIVVSNGGAYAEMITQDGGVHFQLPVASKNPITIWSNAKKLMRLARAHGVSLLHARSRAPAWSCLRASKGLKIPLVTTYHGAYKQGSSLKRWYNSSMVRGDAVIANSDFTRDRILEAYAERLPNLQQKLRVIPRGADLERFDLSKVSAERRARIMSAWHLHDLAEQGTLPFIFILPARLSAWKGHEVAIKAVNKLIKSGHEGDLRLIFCGGRRNVTDCGGSDERRDQDNQEEQSTETSNEQSLRRMVDEYGVGELIHFAGYCEDMPAAYAVADAVLMPSTRPEAFGRVAVEAGAMETIVIAADHGGTKETVINNETGFLVTASDPDHLSSAMATIVSLSNKERIKLGQQAREHVSTRYAVSTMCQNTLRVYRDVIETLDTGTLDTGTLDTGALKTKTVEMVG